MEGRKLEPSATPISHCLYADDLVIFALLIEGIVFSWQFKLQKCVALSKTESEYIAATEEAGKSMWMKCFLPEWALKQKEYTHGVLCQPKLNRLDL